MLTGAILAGGRNQRMGRMKALLPFGGQPLLHVQLNEMAKVCEEILVVTHLPEMLAPITETFQQAEVRLIPDLYPGTGPLGGMHAAFSGARFDAVWVVACDMPYLSAQAGKAMYHWNLIPNADAVIPVIHDKIHPLHALFNKRCAPVVEEMLLNEQFKVMRLLERLDWYAASNDFFADQQIDLKFVTNMNTPEEYRAVSDIDVI